MLKAKDKLATDESLGLIYLFQRFTAAKRTINKYITVAVFITSLIPLINDNYPSSRFHRSSSQLAIARLHFFVI